MDIYYMLALLVLLIIVAILVIELYMIRYGTYLHEKQHFSGRFWNPVPYPEDGEDNAFCDLCHGRLGPEKIAACACGKRFHVECAELENCPECGNDFKHMRVREPLMVTCPICLRPAPDGYCGWCDIVLPRSDGTFRCAACGTVVFTSDPRCRKCGLKYVPRITKGYMSRVR